MHTKFWWEILKGSDYSEDLGVDRNITLKWILGQKGEKIWNRCIWHRIWTRGGMSAR